jgi:hypothetical protein
MFRLFKKGDTAMRLVYASAFATMLALVFPAVHHAQDPDRVIKDGGISAPGWTGKVDAPRAAKGMTLEMSRFAMKGSDIDIMTGPPTTYWNPANTATGDFTLKATFRDLKSDAGHPHPAGLFIGGQNMGADDMSITYCVAYTNGSFLVRQLTGPKATTLGGGPKQVHPAVKQPGADGAVTNEIAWVVKGNRAECQINGQTVAGFDTTQVNTNGVYGIRVAHNISTVVAGFGLTK